MTAEIAILNKSAVALAADSAVTISSGTKEQKIFNTADKLFELSNHNPIGLMIYNGMNFMEAPLPVLIKEFRNKSGSVDRVEQAATNFLEYLNEFGKNCKAELKERNVERIIAPIVARIEDEITGGLQTILHNNTVEKDEVAEAVLNQVNKVVDKYDRAFKRSKAALFVGEDKFSISVRLGNKINNIIDERLSFLNAEQQRKVRRFLRVAITGDVLSPGFTGIVIAGFGEKDLFPTLISFEIDGTISNRLKYVRTNLVDIDRLGAKARVLPFAQREIADRFISGLDSSSESAILKFCRQTLPTIRKKVMQNLGNFTENQRLQMEEDLAQAEQAFFRGLSNVAISEIRRSSKAEIEDMVEFMPKQELAQMAESLVELTSIKRRVSRGMETVGGPIDVAVISRAEGFVWVKRKHYFPPELNGRYAERVRHRVGRGTEASDGADEEPGRVIAS